MPLFTVAYEYRQRIVAANGGETGGVENGDAGQFSPWRHGTMVVTAEDGPEAMALAADRLAQLPGGGACRVLEARAGIAIFDSPDEPLPDSGIAVPARA